MKNIYILPTNKPTGIFKSGNNLLFSIMNKVRTNNEGFHIYITSDEKAKEGDWGYIPFQGGDVKPVGKYFADDWVKVILTTDPDLIADGIQAIEDEFLEWFVKNPSCEYVEVEREKSIGYTEDRARVFYGKLKIIIPQEEPKQETLEEAAERLIPDNIIKISAKQSINASEITRYHFVQGAEWQAKRMYSEEDIRKAIELTIYNCIVDTIGYDNHVVSFEGNIDEIIQSIKQSKHE
jgi:hypothetical protein